MAKRGVATLSEPDLSYIAESLRSLAVPVGELVLDPANARTHPEPNLEALKGSLHVYGQRKPIVVNRTTGAVEAGNGTLQAALALGWTHLAVVWVDDDAATAAGFAIADNRTAELAGWDQVALNKLLREVNTDNDPRLDAMLADLATAQGIVPADTPAPADDPGPQVDRAAELQAKWRTTSGQLWEIESKATPGKCHRILCGDSTKAEDVARLMGGERADACITDPPYGVAHDTDYRRFSGGQHDSRNYQQPIHGDDQPFDPTPCIEYPQAVLWGFNCFSDKLPLGSLLVWCKRRDSQLGSFMSDCEVAWMKGGHGVYLTSHIWNGHDRETERGEHYHPTQKPAAVVAWTMERSKAGKLCYDPFLGSGTTLVAAEQTGRLAYGCEISPAYVAVSLERLAGIGLEPRLLSPHSGSHE